jgi:hypothetical protein
LCLVWGSEPATQKSREKGHPGINFQVAASRSPGVIAITKAKHGELELHMQGLCRLVFDIECFASTSTGNAYLRKEYYLLSEGSAKT